MSHSIEQQLNRAIYDNFAKGESKHSYKIEHGGSCDAKIFSYSQLNSMKDLAKNFGSFMKQNYPEIRYVKDINSSQIEAFLREKSSTCKMSTLNRYMSNFEKFERCCKETYPSFKSSFKVDRKAVRLENQALNKDANAKLRTLVMSNSDFQKVMEKGRDCDSKRALECCYLFGLRSEEVVNLRVKDILTCEKVVVEHGKGNRERTIYVTNNEQRAYLKELVNGLSSTQIMNPNAKIFFVKKDSVNKYLQTNLNKEGITKYKDSKTGIHAIRKNYATRSYYELREKGFNHEEAWGQVSRDLGHGYERTELFKVYVGARSDLE